MTTDLATYVTAFVAVACAGGLVCWLYVRREETAFYSGLALVVTLVCLVNVAHGLGNIDESRQLLWCRLALACAIGLAGSLLYAGLRFLPWG